MKQEHYTPEPEVTEENAPLYLVVELTKKTTKVIYLDTPDYMGDQVFQELSIKVKRLNERPCADPRFRYIGCRIGNRDQERFRQAMDVLEARMVQSGFLDYRIRSLEALIGLLEDQVNAAMEPEEAPQTEYPKSTFVPFVPADALTDSLLAAYALTRLDQVDVQVMLFHRDPQAAGDGSISPDQAFAMVLRSGTPIGVQAFLKTYRRHMSGFTGLVEWGSLQRHRLSVHMLPEETYQEQGIPRTAVATVYDRETEAELAGFFRKWDEAYRKLKEEQEASLDVK